jgi:hypothetical protein
MQPIIGAINDALDALNSFRDALPDRYRETGSSSYSLPS